MSALRHLLVGALALAPAFTVAQAPMLSVLYVLDIPSIAR